MLRHLDSRCLFLYPKYRWGSGYVPENEGLNVRLSAEVQSFVNSINNAKNKLAELAQESKILKQGEKDIQKALNESKKAYGEDSKEVERLTADLADNAAEQEKVKQAVKDVNAELKKAQKQYEDYGKSAKDSFENAENSSQKASETIKNGFNVIKGMIVGYAGKTLYDALIGSNSEYEQSLTSFEVLLQSADKADELMSKLEKMGATTHFEISDLTNATTQLLAFGTAEDDVTAKLQQLGDLSMGNADKLGRLTNAYGKMLAKGKVSLEELNMFTEAGVPILQELQNQYGVTQEKLFSMISAGSVGIGQINSAMESMTSEGGQFFGMMEKQSQTFEGMMSTMSDNATMFARQVGEESFGYLKTELGELLAAIDEMSESGELDEIASELGQNIANAVTFIVDLIKWLYEMRNVIIAGTGAVIGYKVAIQGLSIIQSIVTWGKSWATTIKSINALKKAGITLSTLRKAAISQEEGAITACKAAEITDIAVKGGEVTATNAATGATLSLNAALMANPIGLVVGAIGLLIGALATLCLTHKSTTESTEGLTLANKELSDSYNSAIESIDEKTNSELAEIEKVEVLTDKILQLGDEYNNCEKDTEEARKKEEEFKVVADDLSKIIPEITNALYDETGNINIQASAVENLKNKYIQLARAKAMVNAYQSKLDETAKALVDAREVEQEKKAEYDKVVNTTGVKRRNRIGGRSAISYSAIITTTARNAKSDWENAVNDVKNLENKLNEYSEGLNNAEIGLNNLFGDKNEEDPPPGGEVIPKNPKGSPSKSKTVAELAEEKFKSDYEKSLDYIEDRNFYDDWDNYGDSEIAAYKRLYETLSNAYKEGIIDEDYYYEKSRAINKKLYTSEKDSYKERLAASKAYIQQCDKWDNWGEDNKIDAIKRVMTYTDEALANGIITWSEYCSNIGDLSNDLYSEIKSRIDDEKKRVKEQLQDEYDLKKRLIEDELEFRKQQYDKEIEYLDELKSKRDDEKEDEDYAKRMARLQAKLEYEMDEDNKKSIQKEIDKLQSEIDDAQFERDIERRKKILENAKSNKEETAEKKLDGLKSYYENVMSDINIADIVYKNLDLEKFRSIGKLMGENISNGMKGVLSPLMSAINNLIDAGSMLPSPQNSNVTNIDNSVSVNQNISGASVSEIASATVKAYENEMFLKGRLS